MATGPMVTKKSILDKLGLVMDPELGVSIVDLGLIYDVVVEKGKKGGKQKASIRMTFTTPACPLANVMLEDLKRRLEEFKDLDVDVHIVFEPLWNPSMMSKKAKAKLGML